MAHQMSDEGTHYYGDGCVPCHRCKGSGKGYPEHLAGHPVALDTVPGYDPRVTCPDCEDQ